MMYDVSILLLASISLAMIIIGLLGVPVTFAMLFLLRRRKLRK